MTEPVKLVLVDSLAVGKGTKPGAARRCGNHSTGQKLMIRCPACAKVSNFPVFPSCGATGQTWTPEMSKAGFGLAEPIGCGHCDWEGRLRDGRFFAEPGVLSGHLDSVTVTAST